jgi:hypothetical protein
VQGLVVVVLKILVRQGHTVMVQLEVLLEQIREAVVVEEHILAVLVGLVAQA